MHPLDSKEFVEELKQSEFELDERLQDTYRMLAESGGMEENRREILYAETHMRIDALKKTAGAMSGGLQKALAAADELETRMREVAPSRKKHLIPKAPANAVIDLEETKTRHFAQGTNFYKIFLIGFLGSFAGVVVELLWCLMKNGYLESRSGLVYGPLNPLYGVGAVVLTLALYKYRNRSSVISLFGGMLVGSVVEYLCSWGQEALFGSRSWDYSAMPFNLNGRICLMYSIFWGFLGVLWIKNIYPRMAKWILHIPNRFGKALTWGLVVFMMFDCAVSLAAVDRWAARRMAEPASTAVGELIDQRFPDERMEQIYANMQFQ